MSEAPVDPTSTGAWSRLTALAQGFEPDLRAWFADDPGRVERFTFTAGDLHVDLSKSFLDDDLVVEDTVNTMPEATMKAVADHGDIKGDQVRPCYADAAAHMQALAAAGIDYDDVIEVLIKEGVDKFIAAWDELLDSVSTALEAAAQ